MINAEPYKRLCEKFSKFSFNFMHLKWRSKVYVLLDIYVAAPNESYDYLVAERIHRSAKFLSAVVSGKPIISLKWLEELNKRDKWLDPLSYQLKDDEGEKQFNFSLSETLGIAMRADRKLFHNYSILITTHTTPVPDKLKGNFQIL